MTKVILPSKFRETAHLSPELPEQVREAKKDNQYRHEADNYRDDALWTPVGKMFKELASILPEKIIEELRAFADDANQKSWRYGDLANEVYARASANGVTSMYTFNDCCYFTAGVGGKNYSTIKGYAIVARRFTPEVREAFNWRDIPFSHFSYAGQAKFSEINTTTGNPFWRDILEYSFNMSMAEGRQVPERELRVKFEGKTYDPNKQSFKLGSLPKVEGYVTPLQVRPAGYVSPEDQMDVAKLAPDEMKNYVANRLELIVGELSGLAQHIVGNIPNFPSQVFSSAILMLSEVIKRTRQY